MAKVITFSRQFPKDHPRSGEPTYFVEQVLNALGIDWNNNLEYQRLLYRLNPTLTDQVLIPFWHNLRYGTIYNDSNQWENRKPHTIRSGNRWKAGDKFSPRVWSGTPYNSPQIIFAPEVELKQVIPIKIAKTAGNEVLTVVGRYYASVGPANSEIITSGSIFPTLAKNDGLALQDFLDWFKYPKPFQGQILAWREVGYV